MMLRSASLPTFVLHEVVHVGYDLVARLVAERVRPHLHQLAHLAAHRVDAFLSNHTQQQTLIMTSRVRPHLHQLAHLAAHRVDAFLSQITQTTNA